jgi:hypothetical protein
MLDFCMDVLSSYADGVDVMRLLRARPFINSVDVCDVLEILYQAGMSVRERDTLAREMLKYCMTSQLLI